MRVRFATDGDAGEVAELGRLGERIDGFWLAAFGELQKRAGARRDGALSAELEPRLARLLDRVHPGLAIELQVEVESKSALRAIVFPSEDPALDPIATEVVRRAPVAAELTCVRHRSSMSVGAALEDVKARLGADLSLARARLGFSRGHLIEVVVYSPSFGSSVDDVALDAANLLLPRLVGDALYDDWVGSVDVAPLPRSGALRVVTDVATRESDTLPLSEVLDAARAAVKGAEAQLPEAPYHEFCERADWVLLEMEPQAKADYAEAGDLVLFSTMVPEAMKSFLAGERFSSVRFSNHGERFVYLKVDAEHLAGEARFDLRVALEESLNVALVPGRAGAVVGAGVGLRYVYLVLALASVEHALGVVRKLLDRLGIGPRAWILFCDSAWENEWYGARPDSPRPFMEK